MIIFITGGARSGKSSFAEKLARDTDGRVIYIATAEAKDEEMEKRIENHKKRRPYNWITIEEPLYVSKVLEKITKENYINDLKFVLLDCIALYTSNWILKDFSEDIFLQERIRGEFLQELEEMLKNARKLNAKFIIVSNEVGLGIVPEYPLARFYRDLLGEANQRIAEASEEVYFMVSGIPLKIK
ncbi:bifunctional adenosylcobinamide kinase/adenosylcobinamide-phosphate guanylyltransferase [Thermovenabulum sp.]|uniref:bifunctional adenosylcobinamide kinase/adenosylcobinamide-phosphate guanylyltransferase n=1 Tax=Thermovenabulum sp. TaxID=3100335 RepID=UPI003C7A32DB